MIAEKRNHWYDSLCLKLLAGLYLFVCGVCALRYLIISLSASGAHVPWAVQGLCFGGLISSAVYFIRPRAGWVGLLVVTILAILCTASEGRPEAMAFHVVVLAILLTLRLGSTHDIRLARN